MREEKGIEVGEGNEGGSEIVVEKNSHSWGVCVCVWCWFVFMQQEYCRLVNMGTKRKSTTSLRLT